MENSLKDLRLKSGYTTTKILNELGVARSTLFFWEKGKFLPSKLAIDKLAEIYNVPIEEIRSCLGNGQADK